MDESNCASSTCNHLLKIQRISIYSHNESMQMLLCNVEKSIWIDLKILRSIFIHSNIIENKNIYIEMVRIVIDVYISDKRPKPNARISIAYIVRNMKCILPECAILHDRIYAERRCFINFVHFERFKIARYVRNRTSVFILM